MFRSLQNPRSLESPKSGSRLGLDHTRGGSPFLLVALRSASGARTRLFHSPEGYADPSTCWCLRNEGGGRSRFARQKGGLSSVAASMDPTQMLARQHCDLCEDVVRSPKQQGTRRTAGASARCVTVCAVMNLSWALGEFLQCRCRHARRDIAPSPTPVTANSLQRRP